jgi:hypothetical protein
MNLQEKINQIRIQSLYLTPKTFDDCKRIEESLAYQKSELFEKYEQDLDYLKSKIAELDTEHKIMLEAYSIVEQRLLEDRCKIMYTK